jgi:MFS transporter, ACS family, D-galactonate transporter
VLSAKKLVDWNAERLPLDIQQCGLDATQRASQYYARAPIGGAPCLWGIASAITALATGCWSLFVGRLLLGMAEVPSFLASSKATGYWLPRCERWLATTIFDASQKFGNAVGVPLVAFAIFELG